MRAILCGMLAGLIPMRCVRGVVVRRLWLGFLAWLPLEAPAHGTDVLLTQDQVQEIGAAVNRAKQVGTESGAGGLEQLYLKTFLEESRDRGLSAVAMGMGWNDGLYFSGYRRGGDPPVLEKYAMGNQSAAMLFAALLHDAHAQPLVKFMDENRDALRAVPGVAGIGLGSGVDGERFLFVLPDGSTPEGIVQDRIRALATELDVRVGPPVSAILQAAPPDAISWTDTVFEDELRGPGGAAVPVSGPRAMSREELRQIAIRLASIFPSNSQSIDGARRDMSPKDVAELLAGVLGPNPAAPPAPGAQRGFHFTIMGKDSQEDACLLTLSRGPQIANGFVANAWQDAYRPGPMLRFALWHHPRHDQKGIKNGRTEDVFARKPIEVWITPGLLRGRGNQYSSIAVGQDRIELAETSSVIDSTVAASEWRKVTMTFHDNNELKSFEIASPGWTQECRFRGNAPKSGGTLIIE